MEDFEYNGFIITETDDGYFQTEGVEFPSVEDAMDWIDSLLADAEITKSAPQKLHTYQIFYVDNATDRAFETKIKARTWAEAQEILYEEYDVYMVTDFTVLD